MGLFEKRTAAFSWNVKGECFGVLMSKEGSKYKVLNHWSEKASAGAGIANSLSKGQAALGVRENDFIVVGEMGMRCSFKDIQLPCMPAKDLQRSLSFSLASHFPIDPADLHWAFRIVNEKDITGQSLVRLMAIENNVWNDWLDSVGTLKVDQILPAAAVVDSVLEKDVYIPKSDNTKPKASNSGIENDSSEKGFLVSKNEDGLQTVSICLEKDLESTFGAGDNPLDSELLELGSLNDKNPDIQKRFSQVILLAIHGLTANLKKESETGFKIPQEMVPKRNVLLTNLCLVLAIYILALGVFQGSKYIGTRKKEASSIKETTEKLMIDAKKNAIDPKQLETLQQLKIEIDEKVERLASPKDVLALITENLPKEFYVYDFYLRQNRATCKIKKSDPAASSSVLHKKFKDLDFFEDDISIEDNVTNNLITLDLKVQEKILPEEAE